MRKNGEKCLAQNPQLYTTAIKANCSMVSIRLGYEDLKGNDILAVTESQAKKLAKAYESKKGLTIKMSLKQLKHNMKVEGGFLGLLAG